MTGSMQRAIDTTKNRRELQERYNKEHGITPTTVKKAIADSLRAEVEAETVDVEAIDFYKVPKDELAYLSKQLTEQMEMAASNLQFEKAAELRDQVEEIKDIIKSKKIK
jgi:excinuclease ABC subunit B